MQLDPLDLAGWLNTLGRLGRLFSTRNGCLGGGVLLVSVMLGVFQIQRGRDATWVVTGLLIPNLVLWCFRLMRPD